MTDWTHDALAADLLDARHLVGEIAMERLSIRGGVLDVAAMRLSWSRPRLTGYEVKISRADFLADVRPGKYRNYLPSLERLYFAVPRGLIDKRECPVECGLLFRGEKGWYSARSAPARPVAPERHAGFVQALLFRHYPAPWDGAHRAQAAAVAMATTPPCAKCGHPMGLHSYGRCRKCDCYLENWQQESMLSIADVLERSLP